MSTRQMIQLWRHARQVEEPFYLATVVYVEGSAYAKPGSRMLVTASGKRCGMISGGCLEADIVRRIAWLTANGPCIQTYRSQFEEDEPDVGGTGCGGTIWIVLQSSADAEPVLMALADALDEEKSSVVVMWLSGPNIGTTNVFTEGEMDNRAHEALSSGQVIMPSPPNDSSLPDWIMMPVTPPPHLFLFGAGDDVLPVIRFAEELGWKCTVADRRAHLLSRSRFPESVELRRLDYVRGDDGHVCSVAEQDRALHLSQDALVVLLTHSFEQDCVLLKALLPQKLNYLGILGPVHRTNRVLCTISQELTNKDGEWLKRLHAPVGLPIGSGDAATIALSIVAEIQSELHGKQVTVLDKPLAGNKLSRKDPLHVLSCLPSPTETPKSSRCG